MLYKVTYYENFYATVEIEAANKEDAVKKFEDKWANDSEFVDQVYDAREVADSGIDVE